MINKFRELGTLNTVCVYVGSARAGSSALLCYYLFKTILNVTHPHQV